VSLPVVSMMRERRFPDGFTGNTFGNGFSVGQLVSTISDKVNNYS
jgi:hypothetical protein